MVQGGTREGGKTLRPAGRVKAPEGRSPLQGTRNDVFLRHEVSMEGYVSDNLQKKRVTYCHGRCMQGNVQKVVDAGEEEAKQGLRDASRSLVAELELATTASNRHRITLRNLSPLRVGGQVRSVRGVQFVSSMACL